ncbi:MAG TPA: hypothetical protein VFE91_03555 [Nitrososphaerales archaeon]|nr:hypothetical protein [Nitrososphaerales archaeon]
MDVRRFRSDLNDLAARVCQGEDGLVKSKVLRTADVLVELYRKNQVKINHSALELVCAKGLIEQGYDVKVEHRLDRMLVCDVFGRGTDGTKLVEIETGFIPPEAALKPSTYALTRIASKIARYSRFSKKFALGTTPSYVLDIPEFFVKSEKSRRRDEAAEIKALTDLQYNRPPISMDDLMKSSLHSIILIDVDSGKTWEMDPGKYVSSAKSFMNRHATPKP